MNSGAVAPSYGAPSNQGDGEVMLGVGEVSLIINGQLGAAVTPENCRARRRSNQPD
jgi:hypothetical protein